MATNTQPYKGTRDFYPDDMQLRKWMFSKWREVCERFGYEEYDGPILEPLELYTTKTSDEIVNDQTYSFTDRGGRQVVMRPEMTPTVSRMVAARRQELTYPLRLYSIPNCFRYERPQKGRLREFWQLNADVFGIESAQADLEIIRLADAIMKSFGAKPNMYEFKISSRKFVSDIFDELELDQDARQKLLTILDKKDKTDATKWEQLIYAVIGTEKTASLLELFKSDTIPEIAKSLMDDLAEVGISNVSFSKYLSRGFQYYTDIIFEVFDTNPENNRSMFGGGRYDGLIAQMGVEALPTVGFGMGDVTLAEFLKTNDLMPTLKSSTELYVAIIGVDPSKARPVVDKLRDMDVNVAVDTGDRKVEKQIKTAEKLGVKYILFVGENELNSHQYSLKDIDSGEAVTHSLERIASIVKDYRK